MSNQNYILEAENLHKSFGSGLGKTDVLRGLNLKVKPGEFVAIMGQSGCGKSTLLNLLGLLSFPDQGKIRINQQTLAEVSHAGKSISKNLSLRQKFRREKIGFVFQRFNLLAQLTGLENIKISLKVKGLKFDNSVNQLIEKLGVLECSKRKPSEMSIGQQQRIAVARALAHKPGLILADEPTGNLDSQAGSELLELFSKVNRKNSQSIIMITHSQQAASFASRILRMKDGKIIE